MAMIPERDVAMEDRIQQAPARRKVTGDEAATIEALVKSARESLLAAGIEARTPKFPFSLHHELYRGRLRRKDWRPRHADVALMLERWAAQRASFAESYAWQAVAGAVAALKPTAPLPHDIAAGIASVSGEGCFEDWVRETALSAAA